MLNLCRVISCLWAVIMVGNKVLGQDSRSSSLFDLKPSCSYAAHLMATSHFVESALEYERLMATFQGQDSLKWYAGKAWHAAGQTSKALQLVKDEMPDNTEKAAMWVIWNLNQDGPNEVDAVNLKIAGLPDPFLSDVGMLQLICDVVPEKRGFNGNSNIPPGWGDLWADRKKWHPKHPGIAAMGSALIPGLGKVYTRDYKDAAMSFLYISLSAYQVYRGLEKKNGQWAPYSIIFAGIGSVFYLGNIYGSYKSALRFNANSKKEFKHRAEKIFSEKYINN